MSKQGCLENSAGSLLEVDYVSMLYSKNDQITGHKNYDRHLNWTEVFQFHNPQCSKGTLALPRYPIRNYNTTSFQVLLCCSSLLRYGKPRQVDKQ